LRPPPDVVAKRLPQLDAVFFSLRYVFSQTPSNFGLPSRLGSKPFTFVRIA
jgi:hypothetical protein